MIYSMILLRKTHISYMHWISMLKIDLSYNFSFGKLFHNWGGAKKIGGVPPLQFLPASATASQQVTLTTWPSRYENWEMVYLFTNVMCVNYVDIDIDIKKTSTTTQEL
jgi:hypothetical protein